MKIARLVGLAFAAVLAVSAVVATAASAALPEFKPSTKQSFTTTSGTSTLAGGGNEVVCTADSSTGEITGATSVGSVIVKFTGCKSSGSGGSGCAQKSVGASGTEEIVTTTLNGLLGTVKSAEAASETGLYLAPASGKKFTTLAGTTCTPESAVTGTIAGEVTPKKVSQTTGKLIFTASNKKEKIKAIGIPTGEVSPELVAFSETATESTSEEVKFTKAVEVT